MSYVQFNLFLIMSHQSQNHEILAIKPHQMQWNLVGSMQFWQSNLTKPNGILWDP